LCGSKLQKTYPLVITLRIIPPKGEPGRGDVSKDGGWNNGYFKRFGKDWSE